MTYFKRAVRENVPLLIGLAGGTGSGKTKSAMELAKGMSGGKPFAVIDTEAGRAKHYADEYTFDHADIQAPFRPETYLKAIEEADKAGYPVIVVDSMSHEWAGDGGILDWQEAEFQRMGGKDSVKFASWIKPKGAHKKMMTRLLQLRAHLILCFRAEAKVDMVRDPATGKTEIVEKKGPGGFKGWLPICEKNMPYELTLSFLLMAEEPGVPKPIKLEGQHRPFFPAGQVITADAGHKLAEWARGGVAPQPAAQPASRPKPPPAAVIQARQPEREPFGADDDPEPEPDTPQPGERMDFGAFWNELTARKVAMAAIGPAIGIEGGVGALREWFTENGQSSELVDFVADAVAGSVG